MQRLKPLREPASSRARALGRVLSLVVGGFGAAVAASIASRGSFAPAELSADESTLAAAVLLGAWLIARGLPLVRCRSHESWLQILRALAVSVLFCAAIVAYARTVCYQPVGLARPLAGGATLAGLVTAAGLLVRRVCVMVLRRRPMLGFAVTAQGGQAQLAPFFSAVSEQPLLGALTRVELGRNEHYRRARGRLSVAALPAELGWGELGRGVL